MPVGIIIVNYNTPELVQDCLNSLSGQIDHKQDKVIVIDNNSNDSSVNTINKIIDKNNWDHWLIFKPLKSNDGFSAGNNSGIKHLLKKFSDTFDYMMLLNPDTIVQSNAISNLSAFLSKNPKAGIVGSQLTDETNSFVDTAKMFPNIINELDSAARIGFLSSMLKRWSITLPIFEKAHLCDWVSGAAMMIRMEVIKEVGLLDEGFFLYFEEVDYCRRVKNNGWEIWLEPNSIISHLEGQSTGNNSSIKRKGTYWFKSRRRYLVKHYGVHGFLLFDLFWISGRCLFLLRKLAGIFGLASYVKFNPPNFTRDLLLGDLKALISGEVFRLKGWSQK